MIVVSVFGVVRLTQLIIGPVTTGKVGAVVWNLGALALGFAILWATRSAKE
jgi:hypothetical protein